MTNDHFSILNFQFTSNSTSILCAAPATIRWITTVSGPLAAALKELFTRGRPWESRWNEAVFVDRLVDGFARHSGPLLRASQGPGGC
jgi:hypothetical protein